MNKKSTAMSGLFAKSNGYDMPRVFGVIRRSMGLKGLLQVDRPRLLACLGRLLVVFLVMSAALTARAEKADREKPLNIEADKMQMDDLKQVSIFSGRVVLTKGSIIIRAERLVIKQDPEGYQHGTAFGSAGKTASFRQKREGADQFVEGYGEEIEYDGKAEVVKLKKNALLKRLEKEKSVDEVCGNLIVYESLTELFSADSGPAGACSPSGRVRLVIQPRTALSGPVAPSVPAAAASTTPVKPPPPVPLKASERPNSVK
jgi:lipopolysaccharide export system protein LptA